VCNSYLLPHNDYDNLTQQLSELHDTEFYIRKATSFEDIFHFAAGRGQIILFPPFGLLLLVRGLIDGTPDDDVDDDEGETKDGPAGTIIMHTHRL